MKKFIVFLIVIISMFSFLAPVNARTVRKDRPVRLVNPYNKSFHRYHPYGIYRGSVRRCNGSCHREDDEKEPVYSYKPLQSPSKYAYGASVVRKKKKDELELPYSNYSGVRKTSSLKYSLNGSNKSVATYSYSAK